MRLTDEDRALLSGAYGDVAREAMEYQLEVARFYGAEEMVSITQAAPGMDLTMNGEVGLRTAEEYAARGARFRCLTKTAFVNHDLYDWEELGSPPEAVALQKRYHDAFVKMGAIPTYSNLPFLMPQFGENVVWVGGNTTILANSYFGARTNLEGPVGGMMAALAGRVPKIGLRIPENRRGTVLVDVRVNLQHLTDWDALGYAIGRVLPESHHIPVFINLPPITTMGRRQRFDSSISTPSSLQMYHIVGRTPEARTLDEAFHGRPPERTITITDEDMLATYSEMAGSMEGHVDLVAFGGHHLELDEFPELIAALEGKKVADGTRLWVFTGPQYKALIEALGYHKVIERAGGRLIYGTSLMLMTPHHFVEKLGIRKVVTDSVKTAKYVRGFGMDVSFRTVEQCIEAAVTGRMDGRVR